MARLVVAAGIVLGGCGSAAKTDDGGTVVKNDETRDPISGRTASEVVDQARDRAAFLVQTCQKLYGTGWTYGTGAVKNYSASGWSDICWTSVDEGQARVRAEAPALKAARDAADAKAAAARVAEDNARIAKERAACAKQPGMVWLPDVSTPNGSCLKASSLGSAERARAGLPPVPNTPASPGTAATPSTAK